MYRVVTQVVIKQITQIEGQPLRNKTLTYNFVNEITCTDSWRDFTNEGKITLPRNVYVRNEFGKLIPVTGNIGGFSANPLLMRGDKVTMDYGYRYFKDGKDIFEGTHNSQDNTHLFEGWISEVVSQLPISFKCEDNFWKLKQTPCPTKTFKSTDSLETIINFLLDVYNKANPDNKFTFRPLTTTTFGEFRLGNETIAEVLGRLRKTYHFESYFRGNELRTGIMVYVESESKRHEFIFQRTIISDELQYKRKEDVSLSIAASNTVEELTEKTTRDGQQKTKKQRLEVLVTFRNGSDIPTYFIKNKGEDYPPNLGGERMTLTYPGANNITELKEQATAELRKYYYSGFKGKFTTFGIPFTKTGDNAFLIDPKLPERNGLYKVKSVEYTAGVNGVRQVIQLDYRIPV